MMRPARPTIKAVEAPAETLTGSAEAQTRRAPPARRRRPGRPRADEPHGEGLREQVIEAAARVYARHGYRGASIDLIASEAGISRPLFYRLFKDRREVIDVVVARANDALRGGILQAMAGQSRLLPMLTAGIDAYFDWCRSHAAIAGSIYRELHDPESPASAHRIKNNEAVRRLVRMKALEDGSDPLHPMALDALICAVEHVGSSSFWPVPRSAEELAKHRAIIERIVLASVARPEDEGDVPGIDAILV